MADVYLKIVSGGKTTEKGVTLGTFKKCKGSTPPTWYKNAASVSYWSGLGKPGDMVNRGDSWVKMK